MMGLQSSTKAKTFLAGLTFFINNADLSRLFQIAVVIPGSEIMVTFVLLTSRIQNLIRRAMMFESKATPLGIALLLCDWGEMKKRW